MGDPGGDVVRFRGRSLALGALLGLVLSLADGLLVGPGEGASPPALALGVGLATAGHGLWAWALATLATSGGHAPSRPRCWLAGAPVALGAGAHLLAVGVRGAAGHYPSWAALQMLAQSPAQLLSEALPGYRGSLGAAAAATTALALAWPWLLAALPALPRAAPRRLAVALGAVWVGCLAAALLLWPGQLRHGSPLTALLWSRVKEPAETADATAPGPIADAVSIPGPSRSAEAAWQKALDAGPAHRPNFLLVMLESVPHDHLGYAGYHRPVSPRLDQIAAESLRMTRVWSASTQSNYAQMAILSSLHPRRNTTLDTYERLDYPRVLPHDVFHRLGYATATISSQNEDWQGMRRFQTTATPTTFRDARDHPGPHIGTGTEQKLPDHLTIDAALQWLGTVRDEPFALYVNLQRTHFPYTLPEGVEAPYQPAAADPSRFGFLGYPRDHLEVAVNRFDNALRYVDAQVGRLYDHLAERGVLDDTLVVIVADHGEAFGEHGHVTHGKSLQEAEARVPLLLRWPGHLAPRDHDRPVSTLDIMPSVLELLGLPPHPAYQGRSFTDVPRGEGQPVILLTLQGLRYADGIVCWPHKLIYEGNEDRLLLFDLAADPGERRNRMRRASPAARALAPLMLAQIKAQLAYHRDVATMATRFAPRMPPCPDVPAARTGAGR